MNLLQITRLREPGEAFFASPGVFLLPRVTDVLGEDHAAQLFQQLIPAIEDSPVVHRPDHRPAAGRVARIKMVGH